MLYFAVFAGHVSFHELMITLFLFLTAPITAKFIAKAQLHRNVRASDLPPTGTDKGWSNFDDPGTPEREDLR
jgi:multicomponent K+:H+ antiporter subunit G